MEPRGRNGGGVLSSTLPRTALATAITKANTPASAKGCAPNASRPLALDFSYPQRPPRLAGLGHLSVLHPSHRYPACR
jgi:hypothetical protein